MVFKNWLSSLKSCFSDKTTIETVRIRNGDYNNCIPERAFNGYSSLESVQIEDGTNITTIEKDAFHGCSSLQSINIPIGVTTIGDHAFSRCSSLLSIDIPIGVTTIGESAFWGCSSLKSITIPIGVTTIGAGAFSHCFSLRSIDIPNSVTFIGWEAFSHCNLLQSIHIPNTVEYIGWFVVSYCFTLEQRLKNGTNYHRFTDAWLSQRFDNLPIHQACYYANDDAQSAVDHLSKVIQENKQALVATDAMGMTPLHILCCNPNINAEMVRVIVEKEEEEDASALLTHTDVTGCTPLQLFLWCRGYLLGDRKQLKLFRAEEVESIMPSLCDLLEKGISGEDLSILFALNDNEQIDMSLNQDEETGLFPFMSAAVLPGCGLDVVYTLAMNNLDVIVSSTTQNLKRDTKLKKRCGCFKWI